MKKLIRIIALVLCLFICATVIIACKKDDSYGKKELETTTPELILISEQEAKEIVWADLSIRESAANNLTVELKGSAYVIAFDWSGFDYQYTVNGQTGEIDEIIFDGDPLF